MFRRAHLERSAGELLRSRVVFVIAIIWLPLLLLSVIGGHLLGSLGFPSLREHDALKKAVPAGKLKVANVE